MGNICFTSIQINHNTISAPHTENNLKGFPSIAIGLGNYVGGRLRLVGAKQPLHVRDHAVVFDGLETHSSGKFSGDRWSLILFVHSSWETISDDIAKQLFAFGLPCPPSAQTPKLRRQQRLPLPTALRQRRFRRGGRPDELGNTAPTTPFRLPPAPGTATGRTWGGRRHNRRNRCVSRRRNP